MDDATTLYYVFSTIPQVLAAVVAFIGAFVIVRIQDLNTYLIGDGQSALNRWGDVGYGISANPHADEI